MNTHVDRHPRAHPRDRHAARHRHAARLRAGDVPARGARCSGCSAPPWARALGVGAVRSASTPRDIAVPGGRADLPHVRPRCTSPCDPARCWRAVALHHAVHHRSSRWSPPSAPPGSSPSPPCTTSGDRPCALAPPPRRAALARGAARRPPPPSPSTRPQDDASCCETHRRPPAQQRRLQVARPTWSRRRRTRPTSCYEAVVYRRDADDKLMILFTQAQGRGRQGLPAHRQEPVDLRPQRWASGSGAPSASASAAPTRAAHDFDESRLAEEYDPTYEGEEKLGKPSRSTSSSSRPRRASTSPTRWCSCGSTRPPATSSSARSSRSPAG